MVRERDKRKRQQRLHVSFDRLQDHRAAISLASSGDSIKAGAATYHEHLTIAISLNVLGSGASMTIIDGGGVGRVITISNSSAHVSVSNVTIRHGFARPAGGGIYNTGTLTINNSTLSGNGASFAGGGAGFVVVVANYGGLTVSNSTFTGNGVTGESGYGLGGGIGNAGSATINNSTLSGNTARAYGGGIENKGRLTINNSTISGNSANRGGGIYDDSGVVTLQNSIVANNSDGNCYAGMTITSNGYNLSSDATCDFDSVGELNSIDPKLGPLQYNGGPTQTQALLSGSPALDAGNASGCTDGQGHLLITDQRGMPRPDKEDSGGCDMGAYESRRD